MLLTQLLTAKADLASIGMAVKLYAIRKGRIPTMAQLIDANDRPGGSYLKGYVKSGPTDPWGKAYAIEQLEGRMKYLVRSFGPDCKKGTDDDLVNKR